MFYVLSSESFMFYIVTWKFYVLYSHTEVLCFIQSQGSFMIYVVTRRFYASYSHREVLYFK